MAKGTTLGWVKRALKGELAQPKRVTVPKSKPMPSSRPGRVRGK